MMDSKKFDNYLLKMIVKQKQKRIHMNCYCQALEQENWKFIMLL